MRVGLDLDGVLFDFYASFMRYLRTVNPDHDDAELVDGEPRRWSFYRDWSWSDAEFLEVYRVGVDAGVILQGDPRPGVREQLVRLRDAGHELYVVTNRVSVDPLGTITQLWLARHRLLELLEGGVIVSDKAAAARGLELDVLIDDLPANVVDVLDGSRCAAFLLRRPWNGHAIGGAVDPADVVDSLEAFVDLLVDDEVELDVDPRAAAYAALDRVLDDRGIARHEVAPGVELLDIDEESVAAYEAAKVGPTTSSCEPTGEQLTTELEPLAAWERELVEAIAAGPVYDAEVYDWTPGDRRLDGYAAGYADAVLDMDAADPYDEEQYREAQLLAGAPVAPTRFVRYENGSLSFEAELDPQSFRFVTDPSEVRVTSATGGQKGSKLARFDLIPAGPLFELAKHYGRGAAKYDDHQWRKGYEWSLSFAAMQRHAWAWWQGEDIDAETGSPHLAAVAWHAFALLEYAEAHPEHDNRPSS